jgi:hypothetical protein
MAQTDHENRFKRAERQLIEQFVDTTQSSQPISPTNLKGLAKALGVDKFADHPTEISGILEEMCEEGYFDDGRPEDRVAMLLDEWNFGRLTGEQRRLYDERIRPLMRIWFFERDRFQEEYDSRRAEWASAEPDDRQRDLSRSI